MGHMSARQRKGRLLTLYLEARGSALKMRGAGASPKVGYAPPAATSIRGSRGQGTSSRRPEWKPWPKFSGSICRQASKRGLFRPMIAPYLPSPNFPPCPTATIGCSAAAPTRRVRPGRCSRRVRRQSWTLRGRWRGSLDLAKVLLSYLIIKV